MCGAWWYAVIKFPRTWIFSALAIVATLSILFHAGLFLLIASNQSRLMGQLSAIQTLLYLVEAVLFVLLVRWLTTKLKDEGKS